MLLEDFPTCTVVMRLYIKEETERKKEICVTLFGRLGKPAEERRTFPRRRRRPK